MSNEKKSYVFYEYLTFFYKKKWLLLLLPLVGLLLGAAFTLLQDRGYEGEALVYVGGIDNQSLTDPFLMKSNGIYQDLVPPGAEMDITVASSNIISFQLQSDQQEGLEEALQEISSTHEDDLLALYDERYAITANSLRYVNEMIPTLEESLEFYEEQIVTGEASEALENTYRELLYMKSSDLYNYQLRSERMEADLLFFEQPKKLSVSVHQEPSFLTSNMIVGLTLGLLLSLVSLVLWKYIFDARRDELHD